MADLSGDDFYECDEEDLTREDLLDEQSDFVESLRNLGLSADFSRALLATASDEDPDALRAAAELTLALQCEPNVGNGAIQQSTGDRTAQDIVRQQLAAESYAEKVASRPKSTSSGHASGKRHYEVGEGQDLATLFACPVYELNVAWPHCGIKSLGTKQAWCKANGVSNILTNLNIELYVKYICKKETLGQGETLRSTSFKTCAGRLGALRDLRLQQLAQGLYTSQEVLPIL